jgi:hypothetical protein
MTQFIFITSALQSCPQSPQWLAYNIYKQCATRRVSRRVIFSRPIFYASLPASVYMPLLSKPLSSAGPWEVPSREEICQKIFKAFGFYLCLWKIRVVEAILKHDHDVISIAAMGSGKTLTFWMPLLFHKGGICQRLTCRMEDGAVLPVVSLTQSVTTRVEDTRVLGITTSGRACAWGSGVVEI